MVVHVPVTVCVLWKLLDCCSVTQTDISISPASFLHTSCLVPGIFPIIMKNMDNPGKLAYPGNSGIPGNSGVPDT